MWIISLAFYQVTYLLGNVYAHILIQRGGPAFSTRAHSLFLFASLLLLPIVPSAFWQPHGAEEPTWRILGVLGATVGLPFLLLSGTSPLLQTWHTFGREGARPYRFYALSNAGSLFALLSYPVVVEPLVSTHHQAIIWSAGYALFVVVCSILAFRQRVPKVAPMTERQGERPGWKVQLLWLFLAASASALLLSITQHVTEHCCGSAAVDCAALVISAEPHILFPGGALVSTLDFSAFVARYRGGTWVCAFTEIRKCRAGMADTAVLCRSVHLLHGLPW